MQEAINTASTLQQEVWPIFCNGARQLQDASFRKLSLYKALALAIKGEQITPDKLLEHPRIIAGMMAQVVALPYIDNLQQQILTLKSQTAAVKADFNKAYTELPGKAQTAVNSLGQKLSNAVTGAPTCDSPVSCFLDSCSLPSAPVCSAGSSCITDTCDSCAAKCVATPPTAADATAAIQVAAAWVEALGVVGFHDAFLTTYHYSRDLYESLSYLDEQLAGFPKKDAFSFGILEYNRQAYASMKIPCCKSDEKCFTFQKWRACMTYPKCTNCLAEKTINMPNEYIPWVAVHAGIDDVIVTAHNKLIYVDDTPGANGQPAQYDGCF
jgi:hypothetical protein